VGINVIELSSHKNLCFSIRHISVNGINLGNLKNIL